MTDWDNCQGVLGIRFNNESLLKQAFVHRSYLNENPEFALPSNERLEFLGDAILNFIVAEQLYSESPELPEGELTKSRAYLVCRQTLAEAASSLRLGDWLLLGQGEEASGGKEKQSNLANAMEALIGAIYLDQGLPKAKDFIFKQLKPLLERIKHGELSPNYKALLQEFIQSEKHPTPTYRLIEAIGPDYDKQFTVEVLIEGKILGRGTGKSKKVAEMEAAKSGWEKLRAKEALPKTIPYLVRDARDSHG